MIEPSPSSTPSLAPYHSWDSRDESQGNGGRNQPCVTCPSEGEYGYESENTNFCTEMSWCVCRERGMTCYSDFGLFYDAWLLWVFFLNTAFMLLSGKYCLSAIRDSKKKAMYSPMDKIVFLAMSSGVMRQIWIISKIGGPRTFVGSTTLTIIDVILTQTPQIFVTGGLAFLACVWKKLMRQLQEMRKSSRVSDKMMVTEINLFMVFQLCILLPMRVVGTIASPTILSIGRMIQMLIVFALCYKTVKFGNKLRRALAGIGSATNLVHATRLTIILTLIGVGTISTMFLIGLYFQSRSVNFTLIYSFVVNTSEMVMMYALLVTKLEQSKGKLGSNRLSTTSSSSNRYKRSSDDSSEIRLTPTRKPYSKNSYSHREDGRGSSSITPTSDDPSERISTPVRNPLNINSYGVGAKDPSPVVTTQLITISEAK